jgi:hypothetical protein
MTRTPVNASSWVADEGASAGLQVISLSIMVVGLVVRDQGETRTEISNMQPSKAAASAAATHCRLTALCAASPTLTPSCLLCWTHRSRSREKDGPEQSAH